MRKKNQRNSNGSRRGNARSGRRKGRHQLNVKAGSKRASRARWGGRLRWTLKWGGAAALLLMLVFGVRRALDHFLYESPKFKVTTIDYQSNGNLTRAQVLAEAEVETGLNILRVNLQDARERILDRIPLVKNVEIVRDLPDRLAFTVNERKPIAWLADIDRSGEPFRRRDGLLLDAEGVVIPCERLEDEYLRCPVIYSDQYAEAKPARVIGSKGVMAGLAILGEAKEAFADSPVQLEELRVANSFSLIGHLNTGAEITFGHDDIARQLDDLLVILAETTRRGRALATANVMVKKNIPVRFVPGGAAPPRRNEDVAPRAEFVAPAPEVAAAPRPEPWAVPESAPAPRRKVVRRVSRSVAGDDPAVRSILRVD